MRSLLILLLVVGTAHGLLGSIGNIINNVGNAIQSAGNQISQSLSNIFNGATSQINNVIGNVVDASGNIYGQLVQTANGIQFAANFLWDNVFGPAYDLFVEGGQLFLDDKFGNIVSSLGRRSVSTKNILTDKYHELTAEFKLKIHQIYDSLFQMEKDALLSLQNGEKSFEEHVRAFYDRMDSIEKQIEQLAVELKHELEVYAINLQGDWVHALNQYSNNIDLSTKSIMIMFQRLVQELIKNLVQVATKIIPNIANAIENLKQQGFLTFLNN